MTLIVLGIVWLVGIYLGTLAALPFEATGAVALLAVFMVFLWWPYRAPRLTLLALIVLLAATARSHGAHLEAERNSLAPYAESGRIALRGIVADAPYPQRAASVLRLEVRALRPAEEDWQPAKGAVQVRLPHQPARHYGDYLEIEGTLETPPDFDGFSYRAHLARQGITGIVRYPRVALLAPNQGSAPLTLLHEVRAALGTALGRALPEPQAALAQGILLGQRSGIPAGLLEAFNRTNTTHVIAISGTNVTLLAGVLLLLTRRTFGRAGATLAVCLGIAAYALLVGMSPSVVRAGLMGIFFTVGAAAGRPRDAAVGLALAAALMTAYDPVVLFDLGFQLSFLATAGLIFLAPPIQSRLAILPAWLSAPLAVSLAAQAATLPLVTLYSGALSVAGPVANLFVPALLPPVMLSGAATALGGLLSPLVGQLAGYVAWLFLSLMTGSVEALGVLPWAALPVGRPGMALVAGYYAILAGYLLHRLPPTTGLHRTWHALWARVPAVPSLAALAIAAALGWSAALSVPDETLRIAVLDVGNGDAILVRTPQHKILVDGGPDPMAVANALGRRLPFWDRDLDLVVLTHPEQDHLDGLIAVLERFTVPQVLEGASAPKSASYGRWQELVRQRGIRQIRAEAGQQIDLGPGITLRVLHPHGETTREGELNDQSIVLRLSAGGFSALLTGDIGPAGAAELLASGEELRATMLKVPHHGSRNGLTDDLLGAVSPEVAIISAGRANRFGHPAPETLELLARRGVAIYRTDLHSTVEVVVRGEEYAVRGER